MLNMTQFLKKFRLRFHIWLLSNCFQFVKFYLLCLSGYADKLSRGKSQFEERFLRLSSDGVLSWYRNDNDDSEPRGSIQLRGERCDIDTSNSRIVIIFVEPKPYQFRFYSTREAQLWLAAFQWHYGRRKLRKAAVPLRNKVKWEHLFFFLEKKKTLVANSKSVLKQLAYRLTFLRRYNAVFISTFLFRFQCYLLIKILVHKPFGTGKIQKFLAV